MGARRQQKTRKMKKIVLLSAISVLVLCITSCGSSKNVPQASKAEQANPYGQELFKTKSETLEDEAPAKRASGKGVSFNESTARQLAEMDARAKLSRALDAAIISASKSAGFDITQYVGGDGEGMTKTDGGQQTNTLSKSISENIISSAIVINTDKYYGKDRKYTIFVCVEYNGSVAEIAKKAADQVKQRISDTDRSKIQKENEKFQKEIEKDLERNNQ